MRIYALLVGINDYGPAVGKLKGAVNDTKSYHDFLTGNFPKEQLELQCLLDSEATRENIIAGFRNHLCRAQKEDVVLFQYAGHGARWKSAPEFQPFFPDGYDEGLICYDSRRTADAWDLADKELALLLHEVAKTDPHIAVIMDSCHSGSGTRSADELDQVKPRASHKIDVPRPLESFLDQYYLRKSNSGEPLVSPTSPHILMAGCGRFGKAYEQNNTGFFSTALLQSLDKMGLDVSYADLFLRVRSQVRFKVNNQTPQFEAFQGFNSWQGLFNRVASKRPTRYSIRYNVFDNEFDIDCGAIHGLPTSLDICPQFQLFEDAESDEVIGAAIAPKVGLATSTIRGKGTELDWQKSYSAELTSIPTPQLDVFLHGDEQGIRSISEAATNAATSFTWETVGSRGLKYGVETETNSFRIYVIESDKLIQRVQGMNQAACEYVVSVLNRIAKWEYVLNLENPSTRIDRSGVDFFCQEIGPGETTIERPGPEVTFDVVHQPDHPNGDWSHVLLRFAARISLTQTSNLMLVWFDDTFGAHVLYNTTLEKRTRKDPNGKNVLDKDPFEFTFLLDAGNGAQPSPDFGFSLTEEEGNRISHSFKLFVSKERIDDFLIAQAPLSMMGRTVNPQPTQNRGGGVVAKVHEPTWYTKTIKINVHRQSANLGKSETTLADGQIRILPHRKMSAGVSLLPANIGSRGEGGDGFALGLEKHGFELMNFSASRGSSLSVVEFHGIENRDALTEQPILLQLDIPLKQNEHIVPIVFDGDHLLLAGDTWKNDTGATQVQINEIPESASPGRSVSSAFKLYFFKTVCCLDQVNKLTHYELSEDGTFKTSTSGIGEKVHAAERILILVHGMFGKSDSIAREVARLKQLVVSETESDKDASQKFPFDLVLGFDYESINTPIEETARHLKTLLKTKGIDANSKKQITIVAHSMGGLVSRWLIEQEEGNQFVEHLMMFGTPNEGSPFGRIGSAAAGLHNLANLAINVIPSFASSYISSAQNLLRDRSLTKCMSQLAVGSEFINRLNSSEDPGVRYTSIAGDLNEFMAQEKDSHARSLLTKIGSSDKFKKLFDGGNHDIAVSVDSSRAILDSRSPQPEKINLPCHHLNYFLGEQGIEFLRGVPWRVQKESDQ